MCVNLLLFNISWFATRLTRSFGSKRHAIFGINAKHGSTLTGRPGEADIIDS